MEIKIRRRKRERDKHGLGIGRNKVSCPAFPPVAQGWLDRPAFSQLVRYLIRDLEEARFVAEERRRIVLHLIIDQQRISSPSREAVGAGEAE